MPRTPSYRPPSGAGTSLSNAWAWQDEARCADAPERDKISFTLQAPVSIVAKDIVRRYCDDCPVKTSCFAWAKNEPLFSGIAGGAVWSEQKMAGYRHIRPVITKPKETPSA
jgi:hypothetical protein